MALVGAPLLGAFEAHVLNVTAQVESEVVTVPTEKLEYGTVFPQEKFEKTFDVSLASSLLAETTGIQYAASVVSSSQANRKNGTAVLAARSDPSKALGAPQSGGTPYDNPVVANSFYSLGFGGSVTLGFTNYIVNGPGPDIRVFEVTGGTSYPDEYVKVEASQDNVNWTLLSAAALRDADIDLGVLGWARYVRLTDVSDPALFEPEADGYDLDAVRATSRTRVGIIDYAVRQKPKCADDADPSVHPQVYEDSAGNFACPEGSHMMPLLCPYLSKHEVTADPLEGEENDGAGLTAFHGLPGPWTPATAVQFQVEGRLDRVINDNADTWNIDLKVPCFQGQCAQDWSSFVKRESGKRDINPADYEADASLKGETFGCDLWVEVTAIL